MDHLIYSRQFIDNSLCAQRDTPTYRHILQLLLKHEIQSLLERLAEMGEESVVVTASHDGTQSVLGSSMGENFILEPSGGDRVVSLVMKEFVQYLRNAQLVLAKSEKVLVPIETEDQTSVEEEGIESSFANYQEMDDSSVGADINPAADTNQRSLDSDVTSYNDQYFQSQYQDTNIDETVSRLVTNIFKETEEKKKKKDTWTTVQMVYQKANSSKSSCSGMISLDPSMNGDQSRKRRKVSSESNGVLVQSEHGMAAVPGNRLMDHNNTGNLVVKTEAGLDLECSAIEENGEQEFEFENCTEDVYGIQDDLDSIHNEIGGNETPASVSTSCTSSSKHVQATTYGSSPRSYSSRVTIEDVDINKELDTGKESDSSDSNLELPYVEECYKNSGIAKSPKNKDHMYMRGKRKNDASVRQKPSKRPASASSPRQITPKAAAQPIVPSDTPGVKLLYRVSKKSGNYNLVVDGYHYIRDKISKTGTVYWKCGRQGCRGRVIQRGSETQCSKQHDHEPGAF